jgi:hypothetical protein
MLYRDITITSASESADREWLLSWYQNKIHPRSIVITESIGAGSCDINPTTIEAILIKSGSHLDSLITGEILARVLYRAFPGDFAVSLKHLTCKLIVRRLGGISYRLSHNHTAKALGSMVHLQSLNLEIGQHKYIKPMESVSVCMPSLHTMRLACSTGSLPLLESIQCPRLADFTIRIVPNPNLSDRSVSRIKNFCLFHSTIACLRLDLRQKPSITRMLQAITDHSYTTLEIIQTLPDLQAIQFIPRMLKTLQLPAYLDHKSTNRTLEVLDVLSRNQFPPITIQMMHPVKRFSPYTWPRHYETWIKGFMLLGQWCKENCNYKVVDEEGEPFNMTRWRFVQHDLV